MDEIRQGQLIGKNDVVLIILNRGDISTAMGDDVANNLTTDELVRVGELMKTALLNELYWIALKEAVKDVAQTIETLECPKCHSINIAQIQTTKTLKNIVLENGETIVSSEVELSSEDSDYMCSSCGFESDEIDEFTITGIEALKRR